LSIDPSMIELLKEAPTVVLAVLVWMELRSLRVEALALLLRIDERTQLQEKKEGG
jgi:hypothetical protein